MSLQDLLTCQNAACGHAKHRHFGTAGRCDECECMWFRSPFADNYRDKSNAQEREAVERETDEAAALLRSFI